MSELLHVRSKAALPQNWSYPISTEIISSHLYGIPQYQKTCLRFLWKNLTAKWHHTTDLRIKLFEVVYTNPRDTIWPHCWNIDIYGVRSEHAEVLKAVASEEALPAICGWMTEERPSFWYERWKMLELTYNIETAQLEYLEPGGF